MTDEKGIASRMFHIKPGATCSVCKKEVRGNVDPGKILTCPTCVQKFLSASKESKIAIRDRFLELGDTEASRSVESFILEEENEDVAIFPNGMVAIQKKTMHLGHSKGVLHSRSTP